MCVFVCLVVSYLCIYMFVGKDFTPAVIDEVQKDSPAEISGLKNKDVIMTTGLLSKKWQKGQFGKKHFMVYDKELQQYIEKFPPEQQAEIKKFAIAYRVGKEEYENKLRDEKEKYSILEYKYQKL